MITLPARVRRALCASLLFVMPGVPPAHAEWLFGEQAIMGTRCAVELWSEDRARGQAAIEAVFTEFRRIDAAMSTFRPTSELARVNAAAAHTPVPVSRELYDLLATSIEYSRITRGAFDITYASVGYLYDYRRHVHPDDAAIAAALPAIDYRHIELQPAGTAVRFTHPDVRIDLGGIGKGYAVDRGIAVLQAAGIERAMVNAGGDTRIIGDRLGRPWVVGIRHPDDEHRVVLRMPVTDAAMSTSGDYERFFEEGGVRYHHILDPRTGKSASKVRSVTIIGPTATRTDALTKSIFVLGPEEGLALIESLGDVDAVVVMPSGKVLYSRGLTPP
ncbi:MAG: FAD:protein FMN transferase [Gammaproteobacteria bacterium]|nr:FAD:protein FMN transferase [Gammaproteobacteria bacterium]